MDRRERLRTALDNDEFLEDEYEKEQIEKQPSRMRVLGRKVMDMLNIKFEKSEEMRDKEMMAVVLREYREEKEERRKAAEKAAADEQVMKELREKLWHEQQEEAERKSLENDMSKARSYFESHAQQKFEGQRVQEILEKDWNSRLTTVDGLEEAVMGGEDGVDKRSIDYDGEPITVYDLSGKPFEMISHAVDYRYANWSMGTADIGNKTAQDLLEHPENWEMTREQAESAEGYGTRREDALGDVISTSYVNSETNIESRVSKLGNYYTLCYGFENVRPDSVLYVTNGDAGSSNTGGKGETVLSKGDVEAIDRLEAAGGSAGYNEVVLRRYDEEGRPLRPNYIIAEDGHITEAALRHAKYFNIPIVNIERANYDARLEQRAMEAIDSVTEDSSYEDVSKAIVALKRAPRYYHKFQNIASVGRVRDGKAFEFQQKNAAPGSFEEKICELEKMEFNKRLDLIEETLRAGKPEGLAPDGFAYFSVLETPNNGMPSTCDSLEIRFRREGDSRFVETTIYDGANIVKAEEAIQRGYITQEDLEGGDSSVYQRFAPLVREYLKR